METEETVLPDFKTCAMKPSRSPFLLIGAVRTFCLASLCFFGTATFAIGTVSAADFPFSDVPSTDPIYSDLKRLYERGVVDAPADGKFHPEALMDRDEFVSIAV